CCRTGSETTATAKSRNMANILLNCKAIPPRACAPYSHLFYHSFPRPATHFECFFATIFFVASIFRCKRAHARQGPPGKAAPVPVCAQGPALRGGKQAPQDVFPRRAARTSGFQRPVQYMKIRYCDMQ